VTTVSSEDQVLVFRASDSFIIVSHWQGGRKTTVLRRAGLCSGPVTSEQRPSALHCPHESVLELRFSRSSDRREHANASAALPCGCTMLCTARQLQVQLHRWVERLRACFEVELDRVSP
jgi:hypothetical protein